MVDIKEYTKNYNLFLKEYNKIKIEREKNPKPPTKEEI